MTNAKSVSNTIPVINSVTFEGNLWLEVPCVDYDAFKTLPAAVEYEGKVCGKTGWNSDRGHAYYSSGQKVAKEVK